MRFVVFAAALSLALAFEDAPVPKPVTEWLRATHKSAVTPAAIVETKFGDAEARVVVLGRAFHGTAEIARLEGTIALQATAGDVIALDVGFHEAEALDRWVRTGSGEIEKALAECGSFGWNSAETRTWLTELGKREIKPTIVGIATGDPTRASSAVLAYLEKVSPEHVLRAERVLRPLTMPGRNGEPRYMQLDDNERVVLRIGIEETLGLYRDSEEAFTAKSTPAQFARHLRLLVELQQYEEKMRFERDGGAYDPRGRSLATNALAELGKLSGKARLFVFVGLRDLARASDPDSFAAQFTAMGGGRFVAVATAAGSAEFRALDPNPGTTREPRDLKTAFADATPLERALAEVDGGATWILDLRTRSTDTNVLAWLAANRSIRSANPICGAPSETAWDHDVLGDFDVIAWFKELTRGG